MSCPRSFFSSLPANSPPRLVSKRVSFGTDLKGPEIKGLPVPKVSPIIEGMKTALPCPLCGSTDNRTTGPVRLASGTVAEGRQCNHCGELWTVDDAGHETR